jgi:hypothetical protein
MTFKAKGFIFKNTPEKLQERFGDSYDAGKKYPELDGWFAIKEEERLAFASYIMNAQSNDKDEIIVKMSGYNNKSLTTGTKYLGMSIEPDYKTLKQIQEREAAQQSAQSLAKATGGEVVEVSDDDLF